MTKVPVHYINALVGASGDKWVLGMINRREDGHFYLEDTSYSVKMSLEELQVVENDSFFCEGSVVLARGRTEYNLFYV